MAIFGVAYYRYSEVELAGRRSDVHARQRAVAQAAGTKGLELRDRVEGWVVGLAQADAVKRAVSERAKLEDVANAPGLYLRLQRSEATSVEAIRGAAKKSLHDGFTACLFVGRKGDPGEGVSCKATSQCGAGEICNGFGVCAPPSQPYNLSLLYEGVRVLEPAWLERLKAASNELEVRAIELDLEDVAKHEVPAVAEVVRRSRFFTAVLDELPPGGVPAGLGVDAGVVETADQRLQAEDHFVRVGIWEIESGEQVLAQRVRAAGRFVAIGSHAPSIKRVMRAQQRQANNCAVASEVRDTLAGLTEAP
jgi:hypothetical protein